VLKKPWLTNRKNNATWKVRMDMHYRSNFGFSDDEVEDMISEVRIDKNAENEEPEEDILDEVMDEIIEWLEAEGMR
jgi:hypothetical protein